MNGKQLRNSILQWAIQGKLVPQDPNDEPASVLLERIREEKARLVKEKKIKRDKNESIIYRGDDNSYYEKFADRKVICIDDEIPFEIPTSWCWARMQSVIDVRDGTHDTPSYVPEGYPLITGKDFYNGFFCLSKTQYISASDYEIIKQRSRVDVGDILFSMIGGNIGSQILITENNYFEMAIKNVALFKQYGDHFIDSHYLSYFLQSRINDFKAIAAGGAQSFVSLKQLRQYLIPVPCFEEQQRIVAKFQKLLPIVEQYDNSQRKLSFINENINSALRKSVLQEAIKGRLVCQNPNDEPASILLQRIREEKQRLVKEGKLKKSALEETVIFKGDDNKYFEKCGEDVVCIDDEIPFEIPESWEWVRGRFGFIPMESTKPKGESFIYIDVAAVNNKNNQIEGAKELRSNESPSRATRKLHLNDILFSMVRPYLRNIAIVPERYSNAIASTGYYVITPSCGFHPQYLLLLMLSPYVVDGLNQFMKGDNSPSINNSDIENFLYPLPPINEQRRIVERVNCLWQVL